MRLYPYNNECLSAEAYIVDDNGTQFSIIAIKLVIRPD
jgi:hypothetical protein